MALEADIIQVAQFLKMQELILSIEEPRMADHLMELARCQTNKRLQHKV